jgi:hypothetical protein
MASSPETTSTLDGIFKRRYADNVTDLLPNFAVLLKEIKFNRRAGTVGELMQVPVRVKHAQGHTIASNSNGGAGFTLNDARPGQLQPAQVSPSAYILRERIAYGAVSRAASQEQAVANAFDQVVKDMLESAAWYHEMWLLYGQSATGIGEIASVSGSSTTRDWVLTAATFAPGLWVNAEGMELDAYDGGTTTQVNTNATIVVTGVNVDTRTISVSGNATDLTNIAADNYLVPRGGGGASPALPAGIDKICTNTGTLFNVSATTYPSAWKASTSALGGAVTFAKIAGAAGKSLVKSGMSELDVLVSPFVWTDIMNDQAALRRYGKGEMFDNGSDELTYQGPNGRLKIRSHAMVKTGDVFLIDMKTMERIGSSDISFNLPGAGVAMEKFVHQIDDVAAYEIRLWSDQALFCYRPNRQVKGTGATSTYAP